MTTGQLLNKNNQPVTTTGSSALYCNTDAAVTTSPAPVAANSDAIGCQEVMIQNDPGSGANLLVGNHLNQKISLAAGQAIVITVDDISKVWRASASGTITLNWLARGMVT